MNRLAFALPLLLAGAAQGQIFTSGSTGADGALTIAPNAGTVTFNPTTFNPPLDPDGDNVFHFTTITVGAGSTLVLSTRTLPEGKPVVWLASGAVTIAGTVSLDGENGHPSNGTYAAAFAGAGGYSGGVGGRTNQPSTRGNGPGGGGTGFQHGGQAGHVVTGPVNGSAPGGTPYGNEFLLPLMGGSGGGGGHADNSSGGGGGGGGALLIASSASITLSGTLQARGGAGGGGGGAHFGGGASGGSIRLVAPELAGGGAFNVSGGLGSVTASHGRVRLEAFRHRTPFPVTPGAALMPLAAPGSVFPPATAPVVKVVRVAGVAVATEPTGSFVTPDVTIDEPATVTVELECRHVPLGTTLSLTFQPETGAPFTATSTPLTGTVPQSTATVQVRFPHGPTRMFVKATWTP